MLRSWFGLVPLLPVSLLLLACSSGAPPGSAPPSQEPGSREWATTLLETTSLLPTLHFEIIEGDATSQVEARMEGETPVVLVVELDLGEYGQGEIHLFLEEGTLLRHQEKGERRLLDPDNPSRLVPVELLIRFARDGTVLSAVRTEGEVAGPADPTVVDGAVAHARRLLAEVVRIQVGA